MKAFIVTSKGVDQDGSWAVFRGVYPTKHEAIQRARNIYGCILNEYEQQALDYNGRVSKEEALDFFKAGVYINADSFEYIRISVKEIEMGREYNISLTD